MYVLIWGKPDARPHVGCQASFAPNISKRIALPKAHWKKAFNGVTGRYHLVVEDTELECPDLSDTLIRKFSFHRSLQQQVNNLICGM